MNKANKNYTEQELDLLSGKIQGTRYMSEVQAELKKMGKTFAKAYIHRVVARISYNNEIWDAVNSVLNAREENKAKRKAQLQQLAMATA